MEYLSLGGIQTAMVLIAVFVVLLWLFCYPVISDDEQKQMDEYFNHLYGKSKNDE